MIEAHGLTKRYGRHLAVSELSFVVGRGEVVGFLGPNGAGKTTTLRMLAGFLGPTSGRVSIAGFDVLREPLRARGALGYMPEACPLYPELRVTEYLRFRAELKRVPSRRLRVAVSRALELARLLEYRGALIGQLSKGYRQRVGLADALLADPPLLILDEPTSGLDPNQIRDVRQVIRELAEQRTILLSTHILAEVELSCSRAMVIHRGRLVASGSLAELTNTSGQGQLVVRKHQPASALPEALLAERLESRELDMDYDQWRVRTPHGRASLERWVSELTGLGYRVAGASLGHSTLEQVFAELTTDSPSTPSREGSDAGVLEPSTP
jgi:ABC-2 type transport system ATP-binding protein